jgi:hypothetical protein
VTEIEIVGFVLTVISLVAVFVHPLAAVPITVYVVVDTGLTITEVPTKLPGFQLYVLAPDAVMVVELPAQIVALVTVVDIVGVASTVIRRVAVFVQPFAPVPVTV